MANASAILGAVVFVLYLTLLFGVGPWGDARRKARFTNRMASVKNVAIYLSERSTEEFNHAHQALLYVALNRGWTVVGTYTGAFKDISSDARIGRFEMMLTDSAKGFSDFYAAMMMFYWNGVGIFLLDSNVDCSTREGLVAYFQLMKELEPEYAGP